MSEVINKVAPWIILGGLGLFALARTLPDFAQREKDKQDEARKIPAGSADLYGKCIDDINCKGGGTTSACIGGVCIPRVAEDGIGKIRFNAVDLGLKKVCDQFQLMGYSDECSSTSQCSADGKAKNASNPDAVSATWTSKFQCVNNRCQPTIFDNTIDKVDLYLKNITYWGKMAGLDEILKDPKKKIKCDEASDVYKSSSSWYLKQS